MVSMTAEVPFEAIYNAAIWRQQPCLTDMQLIEHPELGEFVRRFSSSFVRDDQMCVWWFDPADFVVDPQGIAAPAMPRKSLQITYTA